ncbi:hypothetical protein J3D56_000958 [Erwinia persicina]|jgi:hypothetical protein|uniref:Lipoprotein n=2 Tax=Erwinia TaxID=551 RepID=A0ABV4E4B0_9GAMM|nr:MULTISPECIES: lipoprotein [Erwinia]MCP1437522.1 hypothetical protein [Erwinia persicina]MDN4626437.1 lipoprotein [Erwinia sp. PsM31]MDN8540892.1 lipoprotein [Erwinia sp. BC051422]
MKLQLAALAPLALLLSACTTVQPVFKDNGSRTSPCVEGGPDSVAQAFYDLRLEQPAQGLPNATQLAKYRPYLSDRLYQTLLKADSDPQKEATLRGDIFSSQAAGATSASVADSSSIPNHDARNIPLRVKLSRDGDKPQSWQDEVLMIHEGTCWAVDDVRYLGPAPHIEGGSLSQRLLR